MPLPTSDRIRNFSLPDNVTTTFVIKRLNNLPDYNPFTYNLLQQEYPLPFTNNMSIQERNGMEFITQTKADNPLTFRAGQEVYLLDQDDNMVGNGDLFETNFRFPERLHTHKVQEWGAKYAREGEHYVVVRVLSVMPHAVNIPYPYVMPGEEAPKNLGDMWSKQNYFWDVNKLNLLPEHRPYDVLEGIALPQVSQPAPQPSEPVANPGIVPQVAELPAQPAPLNNPDSEFHGRELVDLDVGEDEDAVGDVQDAQEVQTTEQVQEQNKSIEVVCLDSDEDEQDQGQELHDEGELAKDEVGRSEDAVTFNASLYKQTRIRTSLDNIEVPPNTARDLDPSHAASISRDLVRYGTVKNIGDMAVVAKTTPVDFNPSEGDVVDTPLYITDGRHRRRAYQLAREKSDVWETACKSLNVSIWTRVDGTPVSFLELLAISTFLNQQTGNVRPITFQDTIYTTVSALKIMQGCEDGMERRTLSLTEFVDKLMVSRALGNLKKRQVRRYAQISLRLGQSPSAYAIFMETCSRCDKLGTVHVASDILLELDDEGFSLALLCIEMRLRRNKGGDFERIRRMFYERLKELYDGVKTAAAEHKKTVQETLDVVIPITKRMKMSVRERIWREMVTFQPTSTTEVKKEPTFAKEKDNIIKGIDAVFSVVEVEDDTSSAPAAGQSSAAAEAPSEEPLNEIRRSTRLAEQSEQPHVSYREPSGSSRMIRKKKTGGTRRRAGRQQLQKQDIISALKKTSDEELKSIFQSLNLNVVQASTAKVVGAGESESQEEAGQVEEEENEEEEGDIEFIQAESDFQDDIVGLPFGYNLPRKYVGPMSPSWNRYAITIPSRWPSTNPIRAVEPWLRRIHIPNQHRANVVVRDAEVLRRNHNIVYWRAAFNYLRNHRLEDFPIDDGRFKDVSGEDLRWAAAITHDDMASDYFWEKKDELNNIGFTILKGFVEDHKIPDKIGSFEFPGMYNGDKRVFEKLREYTLDSFPTEKELSEGFDRSVWNTIVNSGQHKDSEMNKKGIGRFTSTHQMITKAMETKEHVWACVARALLDVRVGSAVAALRLYDNSKEQEEYVYTPQTGGRWLMTSKGCLRQQVHTDFPALTAQKLMSGKACPGYFTISTGDKEVPLWVCKSSHKFVAFGFDTEEGEKVTKVTIPPYSIAIGRGDVLHAGASYEDSGTKDMLLRYHMYFVPDKFKLPDGVFLDSSLKFKFVDESEKTGGNIPEQDESDEPQINRKRTKEATPGNDRPSKKPRNDDEMDNDSNNLLEEIFGTALDD